MSGAKPRVKKRPRPRVSTGASSKPDKAVVRPTLLNLNTRTGPPKPKTRRVRSAASVKKEQRTWICVHIPKKMRRAAARTHPGKIETGKLHLLPERLVGDRIWLVGKSEDGDSYDLYGHFVADSAKPGVSDSDKKTPKLVVSGHDCVRFRDPIRLNGLSWWTRYAKEFQGLSHGFQSVKDPIVLRALEDIRGAISNGNTVG